MDCNVEHAPPGIIAMFQRERAVNELREVHVMTEKRHAKRTEMITLHCKYYRQGQDMNRWRNNTTLANEHANEYAESRMFDYNQKQIHEKYQDRKWWE
jgi:hypothetical protein